MAVLALPIGFFCTIDMSRDVVRRVGLTFDLDAARIDRDYNQKRVTFYSGGCGKYSEEVRRFAYYGDDDLDYAYRAYLTFVREHGAEEGRKYSEALWAIDARIREYEQKISFYRNLALAIGGLATLATSLALGAMAVRAHTAAAK